MQPSLKIGTRGSPLALAQAHMVRDMLLAAHDTLSDVEICVISTKGDEILDRTLAAIGGKGLFTEEIEAQLLNGQIDLAVHSSKDMPTELPPGLALVAFPKREDPADAFLSPHATGLMDLPAGSVVGTASLRRQAQVLAARPDLKVVPLRGNVQTRMRKLAQGEIHATLLAVAGLNRLGLADEASEVMDMDVMLPAPAQGAVCIEARSDDAHVGALLAPLNHDVTAIEVSAERALLAALDGSCRTPIAALARCDGSELRLKGRILSLDGQQVFDVETRGNISAALDLGRDAGEQLRKAAGEAFFDELAAQMAEA